MWSLKPEAEFGKRATKWPKKHHRELLAVYDNLDTFATALRSGAKLEQIKFGFMHSEPRGIIAIDQKGGGAGLKETRLYLYPNKSSQVVHLITLGDKSTQKADIQYACDFVGDLLQPQKQQNTDG
jgi:hypothetical protein